MPLTLTESYASGDHTAVWNELACIQDIANSSFKHEAQTIARLAMQRVRRNIEVLISRWQNRGHVFGYHWVGQGMRRCISDVALQTPLLGKPDPNDIAALDRCEREIGPMPMAFRAFYEIVGGVNFVGRVATGWPDDCTLDPLQILAFAPQLAGLIERKWDSVEVAEDPCHKYLDGGVSSLYLPLPSNTFDSPILFEDGPLILNEMPLTLGSYLRFVILEHGGMGLSAGYTDPLDPELVEYLTAGLEEF